MVCCLEVNMKILSSFLIIGLVWFNTVPKTIVFFGDSLTAGYGLSPDEAFPAKVESLLSQRGHEVRIVNAGLSGETSAGGLSRIDWILNQHIDVFVLELGANDGLRGLPLSQTKKNLDEILTRVRNKYPDVELVVAGMEVPPNLGEEYTTEFRKIFPALAKKHNALLIPFILDGVAGNKDLNLPDGIHPNARGHEIVAGNVVSTIEDIL